MHKETFDGEVRNYWNKPISALKRKDGEPNTVKVLSVKGEYDAFGPDKDVKAYSDADWEEAAQEMRDKSEYPTTKEIVGLRNATRLAKAKAAETTRQISLAGLQQPTAENDDQVRLKRGYELFYSAIPAAQREADPEGARRQARAEAAAAFKLTWDDED